MANENDMKTLDAAGLIGTESPAESPVAVATMFRPSASMLKAVEEALVRQEAFRFLPYHEQVRRMALFVTDIRIGGQ